MRWSGRREIGWGGTCVDRCEVERLERGEESPRDEVAHGAARETEERVIK